MVDNLYSWFETGQQSAENILVKAQSPALTSTVTDQW